jgi:hypothetical protein
MAKHIILEAYTFTPSSRTITVTGKTLRREQLLLITNTTLGTVIYNFSDPNLGLTSISNSVDSGTGTETTTMVLAFNTSAHNASDKISILYEETYTEIYPSEMLMDPVSKLRVSTPQALIDTDFEYGTQPTKWETTFLMSNRPSIFFDPTAPLTVTAMTTDAARLVTVTVSNSLTAGTSIVYIVDSIDPNCNGFFVITGQSGSNFTYYAKNTTSVRSVFDSSKTYIYICRVFSGAGIPVNASSGAAFVPITTTNILGITNFAHGLTAGDAILVSGTTAGANPPNGGWIVKTTPTTNTFTFDVVLAVTGPVVAAAGATASLYSRPWGYSAHRPFDGGVAFGAGIPYPGNQVIRQTRRYFRYQSGKGVQFSTGSILKAPLSIDSITSSGATVTVTCKYPHGVNTGSYIRVSGCNETAYNGTYVVASVTDEVTFTYTAYSTPSASPATGFPLSINIQSWWGAGVRLGMFDQQNGFFFEFDGQTLYAVRRSSTDQLSGRVAVSNGSQFIQGVGTRFARELIPGDRVVIRGMSYMIQAIASETQMFIYPEYRGTSIDGNIVVSKTTDYRVPQSSWNIDKVDGTGASGYNLDVGKMQMWYIDYSWYGAGAIRFGLKNQRGEVIYCHRMTNANLRTEAYMRSGNLPARYEIHTLPPYTLLANTLASGATSMVLTDVSLFPNTGTVWVTSAGTTSTNQTIEYISYTSRTTSTNTLAGLTRNVTNLTGPGNLTGGGGSGTATTFTTSTTIPIAVSLWSNQASPSVNHWGSSVMMDGRYDDDKSYVFTAGMSSAITITTASSYSALMSIRLAPSVDNGQTGLLGAKDIVNRMQLTLRQMDILNVGTAGTAVRIELVLNGRVEHGTFSSVGGSSLAQIAYHAPSTQIAGGETIFSFFAPNGVTQQDLILVRDLGTSILGGGTSNLLGGLTSFNGLYPDGPDIITVKATSVGSQAAILNARFSWTEAQA